MLVAEIKCAVDAAGTVATLYVSDDHFVTQPSDTPPNTAFVASMMEPGSIGIHTFSDGRTGGGTRLELGEMVLANNNGQYDEWVNYSFDGRSITIRSGEVGAAYPEGFTTVFTGTMEGIEADWEKIVIRLRDKQYIFDRPLLTDKYLGNNILPNGLEGTATDIKGKVKPRVYGKVFNIPTVPVNTSKLIYQVSDGEVYSIPAVYDKAKPFTPGTDHATSALLLAATPAAGVYETCLTEGLFRLGSSPEGQITADVVGKLKQNFIKYSERFDQPFNTITQGGWEKTGVTVVANVATAPDGFLTADKIVEGSTGTEWRSIYYPNVVVKDITSTLSVYLKAAGRGFALVGCGTSLYVGVNLTTGAIVETGVGVDNAFCQDAGNGWWRVGLTVTPSAKYSLSIDTSTNGTYASRAHSGDGVSGVFVWGAQVVRGVGVGDYIKTDGATVGIPHTVGNIISEISYHAGVMDWEISSEDRTTVNIENPSEVGIYIYDESTYQDCIDQLAASIGGYCGFDPRGIFRIGILKAPAGTPKVTLYEYNIHEGIERRQPSGNGIPAYRVTLNHTKLYTTQTSDIAGAVTADRRAYLEKEYRAAKVEDLTVKNQWMLATEYSQDTLLTTEADAIAEATRQLAMYKVRRDIYDVPVQSDIFTNNELKFMDVVSLQFPRYGMENGKLFRLIGYRFELATNKVFLQLWG
ncbi:MAG: phage head spike fiber domain-containing protein [Halobacteriota archaeon]